MPEFDESGHFTGMTREEKMSAVRRHLRTDSIVTMTELVSTTGMTENQVHSGVRLLREELGGGCVITERGADGRVGYRYAANAPEVSDYAYRRMEDWHTQIGIIRHQMDLAMGMLPQNDEEIVRLAAKSLESLLDTLNSAQKVHKENEKLRAQITKMRGGRKRRR